MGEKRQHLCALDGKTLENEKQYYKHNKIHFGEEHVCFMCDSKCQTSEYLAKHVKNFHFASVPLVCQDCKAEFGNANSLKRHKNSVHQKITYSCKICATIFTKMYWINKIKNLSPSPTHWPLNTPVINIAP